MEVLDSMEPGTASPVPEDEELVVCTVSGGDVSVVYPGGTGSDVQLVEICTHQAELQQQLLDSSLRMEQQLEACISILLIFLVVGTLNYLYKLFKMFF